MVECMEGGGWIVTMPVQPDRDGEQYLLSSRLARFYPVTTVRTRAELRRIVLAAAANRRDRQPVRDLGQLDFDGLQRARELLLTV